MNCGRLSFSFFAAAIVLYLSASAQASIVPTIEVSEVGQGSEWRYTPDVEDFEDLPGRPEGRRFGIGRAAQAILGGRATIEIKELEFAPNPFVLNNILITNNTAVTQTYTVGITLPTSFPAPNFISGNVRTDVIDGGVAPGATVATAPGFPIYSAQIDFTEVQTLQDDPFSVVAPTAGSNSSAASFGPLVNNVPVGANIGIQLRFSLTAGDTAAILSRFDVTEIPEPTTLGMASVALLSTLVMRRRR